VPSESRKSQLAGTLAKSSSRRLEAVKGDCPHIGLLLACEDSTSLEDVCQAKAFRRDVAAWFWPARRLSQI
jgi:hypothetical protein